MPARDDDDAERPETWWQAIPSSIKAISGLIVAVTGLIGALVAAGIIGRPDTGSPGPAPITVTVPDRIPTNTPIPERSDPDLSSLRVDNIATPTGRFAANGYEIWQWTIFLQGSRADLDQVRCVIYGLDPKTFQPPEYSQCTRGIDQRAFSFTATGWGVFEVRVRIQTTSGETVEMWHPLHFP